MDNSYRPYVMVTDHEDETATMTISVADEDYKFDVWKEGSSAMVEFQECLSWRGQLRVSDPDETIYKELMVSDKMTEFLNEYDCDSVRRADPQP